MIVQSTVVTTTDTAITTTQAFYYGAMVTGNAATAVLIRDGGSGGAIIDSFEVAAGGTQEHMFERPIKVTSLYADVDANTNSCIVYFAKDS